ncbi:MAG: DUF2244 domain-containing protein [Verrucomicrobiaceae bacterium]|nr:MAG: DUF2244 domain-containing protein [Verrucomicrobiaceae bacterium]
MSGVLKKLWERAEAAGYRSMASKNLLVCPACGTRPGEIPKGPVEVIACPSCGVRASAAEWAASSVSNGTASPDSVAPPSGTRITRSGSDGGEVVWNIPASGNSGGLMFFVILWCSITAIVSCGFLMAFLKGDGIKGNMPAWALVLFFGLFWAVGIGMSYAALRSKYARHRISAGAGRVVLRRELFGRSTEKSLDMAGINSVSREVFYQKNYRPVHGIEIKGAGGKLRFGSMLTEDEKAWLVDEMKRVMMRLEQDLLSHAPSPLPRARQAYFSIPLPASRSSVMPMALILIGMGSVFAFVGTRIGQDFAPARPDGSGALDSLDRVFSFATSGFQTIWMLASGIITIVGLIMLFFNFRSRGKETRLEGTDSDISIRTFKYGRILEDRTFPRSSVTDIRCSARLVDRRRHRGRFRRPSPERPRMIFLTACPQRSFHSIFRHGPLQLSQDGPAPAGRAAQYGAPEQL